MRISSSELVRLAGNYFFPAARVSSLANLLRQHQSVFPGSRHENFRQQISGWLNRQEGPAISQGCFLICGLACVSRDDCTPADSFPEFGSGRLAPFAARNYYRESVIRLKGLAGELARLTGISRKAMRIFCNSRLPEKMIACLAGLGFYGRNSLVIHPGLGSNFVIAGLFLPFTPAEDLPPSGFSNFGCDTCRRCVEACPAGAITGYAVIDSGKCLQALAGKACPLPEKVKEVWGSRIYGCQTCQDVCPYNRISESVTETEQGRLGLRLSLEFLLTAPASQLRQYFRHTVLGMSWISLQAIRRNALLAAGHSRCRTLLPFIRLFSEHEIPFLADAAAWAEKRITFPDA